MPSSVYETENLTLEDNMVISMKPLKIANLRKFMAEFAKLEKAGSDNDKSFNILGDCVVICLSQWVKEDLTKEWVENNLDINNYYDIIRVASGIDMRIQGNV